MSELLIHSMGEFREIILPALEIAEAETIVEVGAEYGLMTKSLLDFVEEREGRLISIDPKPSPQAEKLFDRLKHGTLLKQPSLEVLPELVADTYLIDGDHNYHTVSSESLLIWEQCEKHGKPFLVFYHDVGWPWGRRDLYYAPERIPEPFRQPYSWDKGVTLGEPGLVEGGFRGEGAWACATTEGGPRNGVLTAIEDFVVGREDRLKWACIPAVFGLGVLFDRSAPWAENLEALLFPYHMNPLLQRLEQNRLECYLSVISWQDRCSESNVR
jgi:hypothetical protein